MPRFFQLTLLALVLTLSFSAFAADRQRPMKRGCGKKTGNEHSERPRDVRVGRTQHSGSGCPAGTMSVAFAPDNLSFSILYDQFIAEVDSSQGLNRANIICDTYVPVSIPDGMQMEITRVDFRGFMGLPARSQAILNSILNFRGPKQDMDRIQFRYDFKGPLLEDYEISSDAPEGDPAAPTQTEVSPCGGEVKLRIYTQMTVRSKNGQEGATATLDSVDGTGQATYFVNWRKCKRPRPL